VGEYFTSKYDAKGILAHALHLANIVPKMDRKNIFSLA